MNQKIQSLISNFENVYGKEPWYGDSMLSILKNVNPETIFSKNQGNSNNIAELLAHIIGWRDFGLRRISGENDFELDQKESFDWKRIDANESTVWASMLDALEINQNEILKLLENSDDEFLNKPVHGRNHNNQFLIEGIIQHDIYHIGQISLLTKITHE